VVDFSCGPSSTGGFYDDSGALLFPTAGERHAIGFEIDRGNGEVLAQLTPQLLPSDPTSAEYREAVAKFVAAAVSFGEANVSTIVEALKTSD
jgi:hypothetical protein